MLDIFNKECEDPKSHLAFFGIGWRISRSLWRILEAGLIAYLNTLDLLESIYHFAHFNGQLIVKGSHSRAYFCLCGRE